MEQVFPFGFPAASARYLTLYVLTLAVHVVFMHYVIAGTGWLAISGILGLGESSLTKTLRDWMPAALSAAITAGVAPLLFVQILYKHAFYTSNLLLFHRWMSILPVLIVGFYLLYVMKSRQINNWPLVARWAVVLLAFGCFAFTGYSWTENHVLSLQKSEWPTVFEQSRTFYGNAEILPRLALWFVGSVPTLGVLVGWQLRHSQNNADEPIAPAPSVVATASLIGLAGSVLFALVYFFMLDGDVRSVVTGRAALLYFLIATVGLAVQGYAWWRQRGDARWDVRWLGLATAGMLITVIGVSVVRECLRIARLDFAALYAEHEAAAGKSGLIVFFVFAVINALAIAWCVRLVCTRRSAVNARVDSGEVT